MRAILTVVQHVHHWFLLQGSLKYRINADNSKYFQVKLIFSLAIRAMYFEWSLCIVTVPIHACNITIYNPLPMGGLLGLVRFGWGYMCGGWGGGGGG